MMTKEFSILLLVLTILSCEQSSDKISIPNNPPSNEKTVKVETAKIITAPKFNCNRIIITLYDNSTPPSLTRQEYTPFSTYVIYETKEATMINKFEQMTEEAEKIGYCCCPDYNYTIAFYDGLNNYEDYYVDTVEYKDKVTIFQSSYQFGYIVDKITWRKFLNELPKISFNEYFFTDLKTARELYAYTIENNLPIINSNRSSTEWMNFDGDFKLKVAAVGDPIVESEVYSKIKNAFPNDTFKIETITRYLKCGNYSKSDDCFDEIILQIFCNKEFYDKFNIYKPKSFFDKAFVEFYVIGARTDLNKLDKIAGKER